jgi:hypothetical protein
MKQTTNIILAAFIIVFLLFGYFWYTKFREDSAGAGSSLPSRERVLGQEFISALNKIKTIKIDTDFFGSEEFRSLKDLTPNVELPEETGRDNPFLPME